MLTWENLSLSDKFSLFEKWYLVAFIGDLCIIFGTFFFYASNIFYLALSEMIIGIGAFCIWVSIVKYFKNTPLHYKILETLQVAAPEIFYVLVGFLPIMIGCCFLAMTLFYDYEESFGGFGSSYYTLVALQCGDIVFDFFTHTTECSLIFGTLFSYMYVFFAVSQVQSIFMVLVEDSFMKVQYQKNYEWLREDVDEVKENRGEGSDRGSNDGGEGVETKALPAPVIVP